MGRKIEQFDVPGAQITCQQLPYEDSEDLLPEVAEVLAAAFESIPPAMAEKLRGVDLSSDPRALLVLLPALGGLAARLTGGRLKRLAAPVLKCTSVVLTDDKGEKTRYDLVKKDERAACFETRPDLYFVALFYAGKVTFARFFPAFGRASASKVKPAETPTASS